MDSCHRTVCETLRMRSLAISLEHHAYLSCLFADLSKATTVDDFEALLPWNVKVFRPRT
jgi:hypothetical protein